MLSLAIAVLSLFAWVHDAAAWGEFFSIAARSAITAVVAYLLFSRFLRHPERPALHAALILLVAFELFSVNIDHPANYDPIPAADQLSMTPPPLVQRVLNDDNAGQPFRVDGFRGLLDNNGSLYGLMDMRGISPLWLKGTEIIVYADYVDNSLAWELFAVKYVFSGSDNLSVPSKVVARGDDHFGPVFLHRLENPRAFAQLYYDADVVDNDAWALELMGDIRWDERAKIVLNQRPNLDLPGLAAVEAVDIESFAPEKIKLKVSTEHNAILSLSLPHYAGWEARVDDRPAEILRAYASLSAVEIPAGEHSVTLRFAPISFTLGGIFSLLTWLALGLLAIHTIWRR